MSVIRQSEVMYVIYVLYGDWLLYIQCSCHKGLVPLTCFQLLFC